MCVEVLLSGVGVKKTCLTKLQAHQVLELGALSKLMKMVKSDFAEEATKALYAVSALIRNNVAGQELFYEEAGHLLLQVTN